MLKLKKNCFIVSYCSVGLL